MPFYFYDDQMLLCKPNEVEWSSAQDLIAHIRPLILGSVINCCILGLGGGDVRLAINAANKRVEEVLAPILGDYLGGAVDDGTHIEQELKLNGKMPRLVLALKPKGIWTELPGGMRRDPLAGVYSNLRATPVRELGGVSWTISSYSDRHFRGHGLAFAYGKDADDVDMRATHIAAAYSTMRFQPARRPIFQNWAWRTVLATTMRKPAPVITDEQMCAYWHAPIRVGD